MARQSILNRELQEHYDITDIWDLECQYNILLGAKSNGKSYQITKRAVEGFLDRGAKTIYLRRLGVEIKPAMVEAYFNDKNYDIAKVSGDKYDCITCWRGYMYLSKTQEDGTVKRLDVLGKYVSLASVSHFSSNRFDDYELIVFEEFVTNTRYLDDEVRDLMYFVSTVARDRLVRVFLVGNTISRLCPYFSEWGLTGVLKQEQGTIDIYEYINDDGLKIRIAVEYCAVVKAKGKMFFGRLEKSINSGIWECREKPHLWKSYSEYEIKYSMYIAIDNMQYALEVLYDDKAEHGTSNIIGFVHTVNKPPRNCNRKIVKTFSTSFLTTEKFKIVTKGDKVIEYLIKNNLLCYSDNLTGTEFEALLPQIL